MRLLINERRTVTCDNFIFRRNLGFRGLNFFLNQLNERQAAQSKGKSVKCEESDRHLVSKAKFDFPTKEIPIDPVFLTQIELILSTKYQ